MDKVCTACKQKHGSLRSNGHERLVRLSRSLSLFMFRKTYLCNDCVCAIQSVINQAVIALEEYERMDPRAKAKCSLAVNIRPNPEPSQPPSFLVD